MAHASPPPPGKYDTDGACLFDRTDYSSTTHKEGL
jgi:hypothetical protein